jgi:hypothetical protein
MNINHARRSPQQSRGPIVVLHATGNGGLLYRALARVLVRRELNAAAISPHDDLDPSPPTT